MRSPLGVWVVVVLALWTLAPIGHAQGDGCKYCDHQGVIPCSLHTPEELAMEKKVLFCSLAARCERCGGTLLEDCSHCDGGPGSAVRANRLAEIQAWMKPNALEKHLGRALPRFETESFLLMIETGPLHEGRKRIDQHLLGHHVADDVEFVAGKLGADFDLTKSDFDSKMRMWIWKTPQDHAKAMAQFLGAGSSGDFKMLGRAPVFSVWTEPELFDGALAVRTLFAHNAAHMLLSNALKPLWVGDLGAGWLDAGVGHAYEYQRFEHTSNYCIEEATAAGNWENGVWRAAIRKRLKREKEPLLPKIMTRNTGAMEQREQALCWSFFEFLVHEHKDALRSILQDLKAKEKTRAIFPSRLGMSVLEAEGAWREWVGARYPKRGDALKPEGKQKAHDRD